MNKTVSVILVLALMLSFCITFSAEAESEEPLPPLIEFQTNNRYKQHYILGERGFIRFDVLYDEFYSYFAKIIIHTRCNKDVLTLSYEEGHSETDTGYITEITTHDMATGTVGRFFTYEAVAVGNPDVSISITGITRNGKEREIPIINNLPVNKVYTEEEIPQIISSLTPPVFADTKQTWFDTDLSESLYILAPTTISEIFSMLSVSGNDGEIKYIPKYGTTDNYPRTGDVFALEFEGRYCAALYVFVVGDATEDGKVTAADARLVLRQSAKLDAEEFVCDVTNDGKTTAADARMILRVAARIDYFRLADRTIWQDQPLKVGPLISVSDGGYMWKCTVSESDAVEITEKIAPSVDNTGKPPEEIIIGAPALQTFILKPLKQGEFYVHFELIRPWETEPIKEFGFTIIADDVLN